MPRKHFSKEQVKQAIHRNGTGVIPLVLHKFWGVGLEDTYGRELAEMAAQYPDDLLSCFYDAPGEDTSHTDNPSYRWGYRDDYSEAEAHSIGERKELLPNWDELDMLLADFPDPMEPGNFDVVHEKVEGSDGQYKLGCWWQFLHERFWMIRGMENLMMDYYDNMEDLKRLGKSLIEYYKVIVDRFAEMGFDGIFTSDDLGHQTGPMMSPAVFEELYYPLYKEFAAYVHSKGMDFFLHSCGDNTLLMEYLIDAGVDVLHPIQKGCMDWPDTVEKYGDRITFLAGFDVQWTIQHGTEQQIRTEVQEMKRIFSKPSGGLLLGAGNGILQDTPLENIRYMLDEMAK